MVENLSTGQTEHKLASLKVPGKHAGVGAAVGDGDGDGVGMNVGEGVGLCEGTGKQEPLPGVPAVHRPGEHSAQLVGAALAVPAKAYLFVGHSVHADWPGWSQYFPTVQYKQVPGAVSERELFDPKGGEYLPAKHLQQSAMHRMSE